MKFIFFLALTLPVFSDSCIGDQYCLACDTASTCVMCGGSYLSTSTAGVVSCVAPTTKKDNCIAYSDATTCEACAAGYYLSGNACVEGTIDKCESYESSTVCSGCDGKELTTTTTNGTTTYTCSDNDCTVGHCAVCGTAYCNYCDGDYAFNGTSATLPRLAI